MRAQNMVHRVLKHLWQHMHTLTLSKDAKLSVIQHLSINLNPLGIHFALTSAFNVIPDILR